MSCIRIERAENGYMVEATDPSIVKANETNKYGKWKDPCREYVFDGKTALRDALDFIERIADKALPVEPSDPDPFKAAFEKAAHGDEADLTKGDKK